MNTVVRHAVCGTLVVLFAGCSSIGGNKLVTEDGRLVAREVGGLPISVQTPKWAVFFGVRSTVRVTAIREEKGADGTLRLERSAPREIVETTITPTPIFLGPTEVYTIDPKRPAFGTAEFALELTNQYPVKFSGKSDDKTLGEIQKVVQQALGKGVDKQSGAEPAGTVERTVIAAESFAVKVDLASGAFTVERF